MTHRLFHNNYDTTRFVSTATKVPMQNKLSIKHIAGRPLSVLVIDDNDAITVSVTFILRSRGYKVIARSDGKEGINAFRMEKPDLVLLDYDIPKIHGSEVLKMIREDEQLGNTPVIMLTGNADEKIVKRLINMGVQNYILKPFEQSNLIAKVEAAIGDS